MLPPKRCGPPAACLTAEQARDLRRRAGLDLATLGGQPGEEINYRFDG